MKQLKQLKRLLCNFAEEEDAVGVVEIILIRCPDWTCHYFQGTADESGQKHSFQNRETK